MRPLSIAIVAGVLIASPAAAEFGVGRYELLRPSLSDLPSWWAEYGRPGWVASTWLNGHSPWVMAGHARGGWNLDEPTRPPRAVVEPGTGPADVPIGSYDSVTVRVGEGGAWGGFRGALATAIGQPSSRTQRGAETFVDLGSGALDWDENALMVDRVDSLTWIRAEALGVNRGPYGSVDLAGHHRWSVAAGGMYGRHGLEGGFAQRGVAGRLLSEDEESNSGASGIVTYRYRANKWQGTLNAARGYDHHDSFGLFLLTSKRDASGSVVSAELRHDAGITARIEGRLSRVSRTESEQFEAESNEAWAALGVERPFADGQLSLALGGGRLGATGDWDFAPAVHYRTTFVGGRAHLGAERVLHAVWSDLAAGEEPFIQNSWVGTAELEVGSRPRFARLTLLGGRTMNRAVITRVPLTDLGLRVGINRDPDGYDFGLAWASAETPVHRRLSLGGEGFWLLREDGPIQPRVDPSYGWRGWAQTAFRLFRGDLGVVLRGGLEGVGSRTTEFDPDVVLPAYATATIGGEVTLASSVITFRVRNLEDIPREEPWEDTLNGIPALGPGREYRIVFTLLLGN